MLSPRLKMLVMILCTASIASGVLLFMWDASATEAMFRNNEALYAEVLSGVPRVDSPTPSSREKTNVPILVYHIIRPSYSTDSQAVKNLAHTPEVFDAEMKYLADAGYHVISFNALEAYYENGTLLPEHPIVISFDDGWSDQFEYAFPILQKYHYTATFFVFTNPIGMKGFMTWDNLKTLRDAGMTIGSHSRSHPFLTKITDPGKLWNEIHGSKEKLEKNLGVAVNEFAYPFGQYNTTTVSMVKKAGYKIARGDYMRKENPTNPVSLYELSALNTPTTTELFIRRFPKP